MNLREGGNLWHIMHKTHVKNVNHMHKESFEVSISFDTTIDQHLQPNARKKWKFKALTFFSSNCTCICTTYNLQRSYGTNSCHQWCWAKTTFLHWCDTIMVWCSLPNCTFKGKIINSTLFQVQYVICSTKQNPYETPHPF